MVLWDLIKVKYKYYHTKFGKSWKHGCLLHGFPSSCKSCLISTMTNFLKFDISGLKLLRVRNDSIRRRLLIEISNKSIIMVEDIDYSVPFNNRDSKYIDINDGKLIIFENLPFEVRHHHLVSLLPNEGL